MIHRTAATHHSIALALLIVLVSAQGMAQKQKPPTADDVKVYKEAMGWFKKAEAMIGTLKENSEEQAELFRKALEIKSDFIEAYYNLGLIYTTQKKLNDAAQAFENVRKLNANFEGIYLLLASTYRDLGRNEDAMASLQEGLKRQPKNLQMLKPLAFLQLHGTDDLTAIPTFLAILELDPKDTDTRVNLGIVYQKHNRLDEAVRCYRTVLEVQPAHFTARYNLALVLVRQKKLAEAGAELEAANQLSPGNVEILERLGDIYSYQGQQDKAADAYQAALGKAPQRADLLSKLAFGLATLKRTSEAVSALEKSIAINPNNADAYYMLGDLYSELFRYDESIAAYHNSLKLDPKQKDVHYNLGTLYAERKRYAESRNELQAAVELDPNYAAAWSNLAVVCEKLESDKEAIQANEKVIALGQAQASTHFRLGILYAKASLPDPAIANFAKAIQLEPDKYRQLLREELKNVRSVLDTVRYKEAFVRLLADRHNPLMRVVQQQGSAGSSPLGIFARN